MPTRMMTKSAYLVDEYTPLKIIRYLIGSKLLQRLVSNRLEYHIGSPIGVGYQRVTGLFGLHFLYLNYVTEKGY